jgi:8-oxo-dGTP diphosphatase
MKKYDIASFIVYKDGKILVEKRKSDETNDPGKVVLPSGHIEAGESPELACKRELKEELGLDCDKFRYITRVDRRAETEGQSIYFYSCEGYRGDVKSSEAEQIFWITPGQLHLLDFGFDRAAIRKYLKTIKD